MDRRQQDNFAEFITLLFKNARRLGVGKQQVADMLGLREFSKHTKDSDDMFDHRLVTPILEGLSDERLKKLFDNISETIYDQLSLRQKVNNPSYQLGWAMEYQRAKNLQNTQLLLEYGKWAEKYKDGAPNISQDNYSEIKNKILNGSTISAGLLKKLEYLFRFVEEMYAHSHSHLRLADIGKYFSQKMPAQFSDCYTIKQLEGDYCLFKRSNNKYGRRGRELQLLFLTIFASSNGQHRFRFITRESNTKSFYINEGVVFRDSYHSLRLIGHKRKPDQLKSTSLQFLSLSVPIRRNEEDLDSEIGYINGGIFELTDDSDTKPYHTWVHLSKIDDKKGLVAKLKKGVKGKKWGNHFKLINDGTDTIDAFFLSSPLLGFFDNKVVKVISKEIKDNYADEIPENDPVAYIENKLLIDPEIDIKMVLDEL